MRGERSDTVYGFYANNFGHLAFNGFKNAGAEGHKRHRAIFTHTYPSDLHLHIFSYVDQFNITAINAQMWTNGTQCILDAV